MPRLTTRPRAVLFDLDGTITDPAPGITRCLAHAFVTLELPVPPYEELVSAIGPPWEHYLQTIGIPDALVPDALAIYRAEYGAGGLFEASVYDGIGELLGLLVDSGYEIALATSKPIEAAERVIEHFELHGHFTFLGGATLDGTRSHKHEVIAHVLEALGHAEVVMVGDRKYDILGARHHGLPCVAVSWGHADEGEIDEHDPAAVIHAPADLITLLESLPAD